MAQVTEVHPQMARRTCGGCAFFASFNWELIRDHLMADPNHHGAVSEFAKVYCMGGSGRCTIEGGSRPNTDWCNQWSQAEVRGASWPRDTTEFKLGFPHVMVKEKV